jgi:hypothetical protein
MYLFLCSYILEELVHTVNTFDGHAASEHLRANKQCAREENASCVCECEIETKTADGDKEKLAH